jgi:hypothetical protein
MCKYPLYGNKAHKYIFPCSWKTEALPNLYWFGGKPSTRHCHSHAFHSKCSLIYHCVNQASVQRNKNDLQISKQNLFQKTCKKLKRLDFTLRDWRNTHNVGKIRFLFRFRFKIRKSFSFHWAEVQLKQCSHKIAVLHCLSVLAGSPAVSSTAGQAICPDTSQLLQSFFLLF